MLIYGLWIGIYFTGESPRAEGFNIIRKNSKNSFVSKRMAEGFVKRFCS